MEFFHLILKGDIDRKRLKIQFLIKKDIYLFFYSILSCATSFLKLIGTESSSLAAISILTWRESISDHRGVSFRARLLHCTLIGLTPAITANVGNSTVQFLVVGVCVRAHPLQYPMKKIHWKRCIICFKRCNCYDMFWSPSLEGMLIFSVSFQFYYNI